ncbi:hypothetical protein N7448_001695 [Penicillium atrosanguineum]|nr:hypothetical protein N7448_001695 [Penicillium atrosanguineum]
MSSVSTSSLSIDEKEGWRQLRKELQSIGITPEIFTRNRNFILTSLQALSQNEIEGCHVNFATVDLGQGEIFPEMLRGPSDSTPGAEIEDEIPVTTATDTDPYLPEEETLNVEPQLPTYSQGTIPILAPGKKSNRVARLLYRITHTNADLIKAVRNGNLDETKAVKNAISSPQVAKTAGTQVFTGPPQLNLDTASPSDETIVLSNEKNYPDYPVEQFPGFSSAMPISNAPDENGVLDHNFHATGEAKVLFLTTSIFEFNINSPRREAGYPYLTYGLGEMFNVIGETGELWLAYNQDDSAHQVGWIWHKHFVKIS